MKEQDLIDLGFERDKFSHMIRFKKNRFEVWFNTLSLNTGFYYEQPDGTYETQLTVDKILELYNETIREK